MPGDDSSARSWRATDALLLLVALALVAALVVILGRDAEASPSTTSQGSKATALRTAYAGATRAARDEAEAFLGVDYRDPDPMVDQVLAGATGAFKRQYAARPRPPGVLGEAVPRRLDGDGQGSRRLRPEPHRGDRPRRRRRQRDQPIDQGRRAALLPDAAHPGAAGRRLAHLRPRARGLSRDRAHRSRHPSHAVARGRAQPARRPAGAVPGPGRRGRRHLVAHARRPARCRRRRAHLLIRSARTGARRPPG